MLSIVSGSWANMILYKFSVLTSSTGSSSIEYLGLDSIGSKPAINIGVLSL